MTSIKCEITATTIANEVRLLSAVSHESFLLVEGTTDKSLFRNFCDTDKCEIIVCYGWENLFGAMDALSATDFKDALGYCDRDYFNEIGYPEYNGVIIFSDENDVETQIICSKALRKIFADDYTHDRVAKLERKEHMTAPELVLKWAQPTSALRFLSSVYKWNLKFRDMKYKFTDKRNPYLCISTTVQHVLDRSAKNGLPPNTEIEQLVRTCIASHDAHTIANGHDCVAVLGRAFRSLFGKTNDFDSPKGRKDLANDLRLSYEFAFFQKTRGYKDGNKLLRKQF